MNTFGTSARLTIFGTSHGEGLGCAIDGLPAGLCVDMDALLRDIDRRRAGRAGFSSPRAEQDEFEIVSGLYNGRTDGTPLTAIFRNHAANSAEYDAPGIPRPSHADYAADVRYGGFNDPRGGGMFSGRMTLPLVFAGGVARQALAAWGISVGAHVLSIGGAFDAEFDPCSVDEAALLRLAPDFPLVDAMRRADMEAELASAREMGDSLGGSVECAVVGIPAGVGEPFFDSCESVIAHMLFSVPSVKAVEFGLGARLAHMRASEANDEFEIAGGAVRTMTNRSGGINGGITNGMPVIVRAAMRPIPTISIPQKSVDTRLMTEVTRAWRGRHDACALPRGVVAIEAGVCFAMLDMMMKERMRVRGSMA